MKVNKDFIMYSGWFQTTCNGILEQMSGGEDENGITYSFSKQFWHEFSGTNIRHIRAACLFYYAEMPDLLKVSTILDTVTNQSDRSPLHSVTLTFHLIRKPCPHSFLPISSICQSLRQSSTQSLSFHNCPSSIESLSSVLTFLSRCGSRSQCKGLPSRDPRVSLHSSCCTAALPPPCYAFL